MNQFATLILNNRLVAAVVASLGAAMPPLGLVGGAATGLITLRQGLAAGLLVAGLGSSMAAALNWLLGGAPWVGLVVVVVTTVPACLLAQVLRYSASLDITVQVGLLAAALLVVAFIWTVGDAAAFWRHAVELWLTQVQAQGLVVTQAERTTLLDSVPYAVMTGSAMVNWLLFALGSLFLARSAQARLFNPGGFQAAFHGLHLGMVLLAATGVMLVVYALTRNVVILNLLAVAIAGWLLQGLAVLHRLVALYRLPGWWLVLSYTTLVVAALYSSRLVLAFPLLGAVDQTIGLRRRLAGQRGTEN